MKTLYNHVKEWLPRERKATMQELSIAKKSNLYGVILDENIIYYNQALKEVEEALKGLR